MEKIGEFERSEIAVFFADFFLEVAHDTSDVLEGESLVEESAPGQLPVGTQNEALAGQFAVESVSTGDGVLGLGDGSDVEIRLVHVFWDVWSGVGS